MKISRLSASVAAFTAIGLLAACGGGGGGGTGGPNPPVNNPPPPTSSSPSPTPTPTATPPSTPPPVTVSSTVYGVYDGGSSHTWGADNWQTNGVTDTSDKGDGDTSSGATGSNSPDGVSCAINGSETTGTYYHVHSFVGIYVNGTAYALPDAIGMNAPTPNQEPILSFACAYTIHTHADSGLVHVEDPSMPANAPAPSKYNLQTLMDIWGQSLSSLPISGVAGAPTIYVGSGTASYTAPSGKAVPLVNSYSAVSSAQSVLLTDHEAIWLVYGTPPSAGLPQVAFEN